MQQLKQKVIVGLVGGSDLTKISEQMSGTTDGKLSKWLQTIGDKLIIQTLTTSVLCRYDYVFSENGLVAHKKEELLGKVVSCIMHSLKIINLEFLCDTYMYCVILFTEHYIILGRRINSAIHKFYTQEIFRNFITLQEVNAHIL